MRPVRHLIGIGNVFLGADLLDLAEYDLEVYEENPEDHEHHGAGWAATTRIEGTVVGELPVRKDLRLVTEEGYSLNFFRRDRYGAVVISNPRLEVTEKPAN